MHHRRLRAAAAALCSALLAGPWAATAHAHESRSSGPAQLVVGWQSEPAYAGYLNAVQLRVSDGAGPITDVGEGVKVEVRFGDQKVGPLTLAPAFGSPGEYRAPMIPTRAGVYTFKFTGTIRGQQVDQTFTSSNTTFESPKEPAEIEFPVKDPTRAQLAGRLERVEPRIDTVGAEARAEADDAASAANRATVIAVAALLVGVAGTALALTGRRRRDGVPATERARADSRAGG